MNKKRLFYTILSAVIIIGIGVFYVHTQRQKNFAETREVFAPIYTYSGKLTPEQQKEYSELAESLMNVPLEIAKKYRLPQREQLALEAHTMTLYRDNPEMYLIGQESFRADIDVKPFHQRHFGILALIAKTKLVDMPAGSRKLMIQHLETYDKKLIQNSIDTFTAKFKGKQTSPKSSVNVLMRIGTPFFVEVGNDGEPGVFHITDIYGKGYVVDLNSTVDTDVTEVTTELYSKIDRLIEKLTDEEFQRLSTLSKTERTEAIELLFTFL